MISILLGLLCALAVLFTILHISGLLMFFQSKAQRGKYTLKTLRTEPDGVEEVIHTSDGTQLRALYKGSGTPVILTHDAGVSSTTMNLIWRLLADSGYKVITYDHRGHGASTIGSKGINLEAMTQDLKDVLDHFKLENAILVGHSLGASLAIRLLSDYPNSARKQLKGVVSIAGFAGDILAKVSSNAIWKKLLRSGFMDLLLKTQFYSWVFAASYFGTNPHPDYVKAFLEIYRQRPSERLLPLYTYSEDQGKRYYNHLSQLNVPCTVLYGTHEVINSKDEALRMANRFPNLKLEWYESNGHMMVWESPAKIVEEIKALERTLSWPG